MRAGRTRASKKRAIKTPLVITGGPTSHYVVAFAGSSTTEGTNATNAHFNYVNRLSAKLLTHTMNSRSNRQVFVSTSGSPARAASGSSGMWFHNMGNYGKTTATYIDAGRQSVIDSLQPELMIHMIGSNDYLDQISLTTFKANLQAVVADVRTRTSNKTKHVFIHSYQRTDIATQPITWAQYGTALSDFCDANIDCYFYDITPAWIAAGVPGADPNGYIAPDGVHCTDAGYKFLAQTVADAMGLNDYFGRLIYHIDAEQITGYTNGQEVTTINYPTGSNVLETVLPGTGQTSGQRPVFMDDWLGAKNYLSFDGSNDSLDATFSKSYGLPISIFYVFVPGTGGNTGAKPIFSRTSSDMMGYVYGFDSGENTGGTARITNMSNAGESDVQYTAINRATPHVVGSVFDVNDLQQVYVDALNPQPSGKSIGADLTQGPFISSLRLGSNTGRTIFSGMKLAEIRVYQGEANVMQAQTIMQELATKYEVTLNTVYTPAVEFDSSAGIAATSGTVISHNLVVGGSDATVIVSVAYNAAKTMTVTCGGVAMIPLANWNNSTTNYINMFYLQGVSVGTKSIDVTLNSAATRIEVSSASYRGVAELSAFGMILGSTTSVAPGMTTLSTKNAMIAGSVSQANISATAPTIARRVDNAAAATNGANGGIVEEAAITGTTALAINFAATSASATLYGELRAEPTTRKVIDRFAPGAALSNWTHRLVGGSTANLPINRSGRFGIGLANGTTTQYFSTHNTPADSDDFKVSGYISTAAVATFGGLMIRCASAGAGSETGVVVHFHTNTGNRGITTAVGATGGGGYTRRQDLNANVAVGDFVEVNAIGNTYTVYRTTTAGVRSLLATWVDSTNIVAPGSTRRYGGIYSGKTTASVYSPDIRDFEITNLPPSAPVQYTDTLSSLTNFAVTSSGSGITSTSDEARWNGTSDGQAIALYSSVSSTNNQYVACVVGSSLAARSSSMIFHNDAINSGYYAVEFYNTNIRLVRTSGRWAENSITVIATSGSTPATGDLIEAWNIGEIFYVAKNGTLIITQTISGAIITSRRYQGFGMYRGTFINSGPIAEWRGGDAIAWGKS